MIIIIIYLWKLYSFKLQYVRLIILLTFDDLIDRKNFKLQYVRLIMDFEEGKKYLEENFKLQYVRLIMSDN